MYTPRKCTALQIFKILCNKQLQSHQSGIKLMVTSFLRYLYLEIVLSAIPSSCPVDRNLDPEEGCSGELPGPLLY